MNHIKNLELLEFTVFNGNLNDLSLVNFSDKEKVVINTINPHSYCISKVDANFKHSLKSSDVLIPDGSGIVLAARVLLNKKIDKITGPDLHEHLLNDLNKTKGSCFYMGSSDATLDLIRDKIKKDYSSITVEVYSPPYKEKLSDSDNKEIIKQINIFSPDVLFVGMTAPKQEKWLEENKDKLNFGIASCVGAAFDWYAGVNKPPSRISKKLHLAWLERFFKEPIRMTPRIKSMLYFLYIIAMKKIKILTR